LQALCCQSRTSFDRPPLDDLPLAAAPVLRTTKQDLQMLKTLLVGGAAALVFMTSHAVADGMPRRAPDASVVWMPNWTGPYVGVGVGGAFATHDRSAKHVYEDTTVLDVTRLWDDHHGRSHVFGTVTLGYDYQFSGLWVAGAFVDYDFGNRNDRTRFVDFGGFSDVHLSQEHGHAWSIGGRLGVLSSPSTLLFVSAGWTQVSTDADLSFVFGGTERRLSLDKDRDGWFVGAGIETQLGWLGSNFSLRGEYRFSRFDDDGHRRLTLDEGADWNRRLEFDRDTDVHSVRAVLVYKFGRPVPVPIK
jgi:outer membrane immunogenic protein